MYSYHFNTDRLYGNDPNYDYDHYGSVPISQIFAIYDWFHNLIYDRGLRYYNTVGTVSNTQHSYFSSRLMYLYKYIILKSYTSFCDWQNVYQTTPLTTFTYGVWNSLSPADPFSNPPSLGILFIINAYQNRYGYWEMDTRRADSATSSRLICSIIL